MTGVHKAFLLFGAAAAALTIAGCSKTSPAADPAAAESAIKADEAKWNDQFKNKDLEGLLSHYADDAFLVASGVPGAKGAMEIRKVYSQALADNYFAVTFGSDKIDVSGDLAYSRGHFSEKSQDPKSKQIVSDSGTYITVYKKQTDGSWKAIEDITAADPATRKEVSAVAKPAKLISM